MEIYFGECDSCPNLSVGAIPSRGIYLTFWAVAEHLPGVPARPSQVDASEKIHESNKLRIMLVYRWPVTRTACTNDLVTTTWKCVRSGIEGSAPSPSECVAEEVGGSAGCETNVKYRTDGTGRRPDQGTLWLEQIVTKLKRLGVVVVQDQDSIATSVPAHGCETQQHP